VNQLATPQLASIDPKALSRTHLADRFAESKEAKPEKKRGFSFGDFLDIINPLQHIPVVNTLYRAITGDTIRPEAKLAGGGLFGGPLGLALSAADVALQAETGRDVGGHVMALFQGRSKAAAQSPALAAVNPPSLTVIQALEAPQKAAKPQSVAEPAAHRLAARKAAYDQALASMAATLAAARALDSLPESARVEVAALPPL
jgi:hypothetical protein